MSLQSHTDNSYLTFDFMIFQTRKATLLFLRHAFFQFLMDREAREHWQGVQASLKQGERRQEFDFVVIAALW